MKVNLFKTKVGVQHRIFFLGGDWKIIGKNLTTHTIITHTHKTGRHTHKTEIHAHKTEIHAHKTEIHTNKTERRTHTLRETQTHT